jgi:uncharacterized protein (TIGR04255 family)
MSVKDHPTYPNPTIVEALCEIHFQLPEGTEWDSSLFGEVFNQIQSNYPILEPVAGLRLQLPKGQDRKEQRFFPAEQRMRYKHKSQTKLIQLSQDIMTLNELPKYPGWKVMKNDILDAWANVSKVIKPDAISRIGLRYIDKIARTKKNEKPGEWFKASEYIPKSVLESLPEFLSRIETRTSENNKIIITLGEFMSETVPEEGPPFVFDVDTIVEKEMKTNKKTIEQEIEQLHETVWTIFKASMTPRLEKLMKRGKT